jgi:proteasome accessory factor C
MAEHAHTQIQRLVTLVAWMSQRDNGPIGYAEAARQMGTTEAALRGDLKVLLGLTDGYRDWLASLSLSITAGGFTLGSRGAFRRPLRLSRDEALALILGLGGLRGGKELAARLGREFGTSPDNGEVARSWALGPTPGAGVAGLLGLARGARDGRRKLAIHYAASSGEPSRRTVHVHQVVQAGGRWYLVAWCEKAGARRLFRVERILEAVELAETFAPQRDLLRVKALRDLLSADGAPRARVAFRRTISRWVRERYPGGRDEPDGRYVVEFPVADPRWLAREVLQYGAEAEVLEPQGMREMVRGMVG